MTRTTKEGKTINKKRSKKGMSVSRERGKSFKTTTNNSENISKRRATDMMMSKINT